MPAFRGAVQTLVASAAQSSSSNAVVQLCQPGGGGPDGGLFLLNVTASSSPTTLDVYLQTSPDAGTTWWDFGHFTQVGAVSTSKQALTWARRSQALVTTATAVVATGDAALAAAVVINGPIVDGWVRVKWVISGTSYTFSVVGIFDRD